MSEPSRPPTRLIDQPSSALERALLQAGSSVRASEATRTGVLEALGLEERGYGSNRHAAPKARLLTFRRGAFLLAAMVVSAAAAVPLIRRTATEPSPALRVEPSDVAPANVGSSERGAGLESVEALPAPATSTNTAEDASKAARSTEEPNAARSVVHLSARNALAAELAALDAVRSRLNAGEAKAAQQLLDAYQRDFPKARLALEAEVLRIDALDRAGQTEAAKKRAQAFVQAHPKGVLTGRVRRYLEK